MNHPYDREVSENLKAVDPNETLRQLQLENAELKESVLKRSNELRDENKMLRNLLSGDEINSRAKAY
jgi:hypothetical protein